MYINVYCCDIIYTIYNIYTSLLYVLLIIFIYYIVYISYYILNTHTSILLSNKVP